MTRSDTGSKLDSIDRERFEFGKNWTHFLGTLDEARIADAESSLKGMLGVETLAGERFLDIGCGSGLFSLAARRLGAKVHSFDFDPQSVRCAEELRGRYFPSDPSWQIESGSVLNADYMDHLGEFDVVYSWGVLHHTGAMWLAIENTVRRVTPNSGKLFIAIYNDQGWMSHIWWIIKNLYNRLPHYVKRPYVATVWGAITLMVVVKYTLKLKPALAIAPLLTDRRERGMSARYDKVDWVGGFPYEFAPFQTLVRYFEVRGFSLVNATQTTSWGCNEYVLTRVGSIDYASK